eukprot:scaffold239453_cov24-Tisochrysis_lutea.AAC.1
MGRSSKASAAMSLDAMVATVTPSVPSRYPGGMMHITSELLLKEPLTPRPVVKFTQMEPFVGGHRVGEGGGSGYGGGHGGVDGGGGGGVGGGLGGGGVIITTGL